MTLTTTADALPPLPLDDNPKRALRRTAALAEITWEDVRDAGRLLPQHIAYCRSRGLHPYFVLKRGYMSVGKGTPFTDSLPAGVTGFSDEQTQWILGNTEKKRNAHASLLIPLFSTDWLLDEVNRECAPVLWQARPDTPRKVTEAVDKEGKPTRFRSIKFEAPAGAKRGGRFGELPIDVHPAMHRALYAGGDLAPVVVLTEGVHKADAISSAAAREGLSVVAAAATGVTMPFYRAGTDENPSSKPALTPAMRSLEFETWDDNDEPTPRTVLLAWDADWKVNAGVYKPMLTTADLLVAEGCIVRIVDVPPVADANEDLDLKTGIDDYLAHAESETPLRDLLDASISIEDARFLTREYTHDDVGHAERLAARILRDGSHVFNADGVKGGYWMVYDEKLGIWKEDTKGTLVKLAMNLTTFDAARGDSTSRTQRALNAAVSLARSQPGVSLSDNAFDDPSVVTTLLNVQNGVVDLRTGELLPHDPRYRMTQVAAFRYDPQVVADLQRYRDAGDDTYRALERVGAPSFAYYLKSTLDTEDRARTLQECIGYSFVGRVLEEVMYLWYSSGGRSGKGILLELLQNHVYGDYETTTRPEALMKELTDEHLVNLKGRRVAVMQETGEGMRLNEVSLKQLASRDKVAGRQLYKERDNFRPSHTLILASNHLPIVTATDPGTWDRMILLTFPHTFSGGARQETLPDALEAEAPIIAAWFVLGAMAVLETSKPFRSDEVIAEKEAWRNRSDLLGQFLDEKCVVGTDLQVERSEFTRAYRAYCEELGIRAISTTSLMRVVLARSYKDTEGRKVAVEEFKNSTQRLRGIGLRSSMSVTQRARRR